MHNKKILLLMLQAIKKKLYYKLLLALTHEFLDELKGILMLFLLLLSVLAQKFGWQPPLPKVYSASRLH
jgi:hypothetical protein